MVLLDPLAPSQILLGGPARLSEERVHQQAVCDERSGDWYLTQVVDGGRLLPGELVPPTAAERSARGDMAITRLSPEGEQLGTMYCRRFDHGGGLAIDYESPEDPVPRLWVAYDAEQVPLGQNAHGRRIARFAFQPGAVIDVGNPTVQVFDPFPTSRAVLPSIDLVNNRIAINYAIPGEQRRYRVWDLTEFKAGNFPAYIADFPWNEQEQFQSFTLFDEHVYQTHGRQYSGTNPVPGDAFFAIINIFTGRTVRIAANYEHPDLDYREPESITVLAANPAGPQLVYGFATGPSPRQASLYATEAGAGPGTWISSTIVDDQGISITASVEDRTGLRGWRIVRRPDGAVLFTGSAAEFPAGVAEMIDTRPPVCTPLIYNLVLDYEDREELHESRPLTWTPPGGCGTGPGGPVVDAPDTLSCAQSYTARIHWRGGALVKPLELMNHVSEVTWSRTLNDVSTAEVTLSKISDDCCRELQDVHDWVHELSIYRNVRGTPELVWQGPIQTIRIRRETVVIEAADVFAWLDKLVNTYRVTYNTAAPIRGNRRRGTIVYMAQNHLRLNLLESSLSVPRDYPGIMDYVVAREDGLPVISVEKDGSAQADPPNSAIWTEYLGEIFREWIKRGLTWTTVGRSIVFRGFANQQTLPITRLSMNDFMGDVEVVRDGTNTATYGFATNQDTQDIAQGFTVGWGYSGTAYGRLDSLVEVNEEYETAAEAQTELRQAARREIAGRYPTPLVIRVPDNSQISPDAPITMDMLVPGERVDVFGDNYCIDIAQGFGIADVEGRWQQGREEISIGLIPLDDLGDGADVPPDDGTP